MSHTIRALVARRTDPDYVTRLEHVDRRDLPAGDVLVHVVYSSLNYKDALGVTGRGKVIRRFPMVCGIDLAGQVVESRSPDFTAGDEVIAVGHGLGETVWGGYSDCARLPADAVRHRPKELSPEQAMAIGTAGVTAMLALLALEQHGILPGEKDVLVTGASGGVGSLAVALLGGRGYRVIASTGKQDAHEYLRSLGATTIVDRTELAQKGPPLASERWAGAIDTVGGETLAAVLSATAAYGAVAACGLAGGTALNITVFPFILRNVSLLGINSVYPPRDLESRAWQRLADPSFVAKLETIATVEPLSNIMELADRMLAGRIRGRVVLDVSA